MPVITDDVISIGNNGTIYKFIVIHVNGNEVESVLSIYPKHSSHSLSVRSTHVLIAPRLYFFFGKRTIIP